MSTTLYLKSFPTFVKQIVAFVLVVVPVFGWGQTTVTFTSNGSWTVPCGVSSITVAIWGGGGGGGGDATTNGYPAGAGGGSGAYVQYLNFPVSAGQIFNYTIGSGGAGIVGAAAPTAANSGGTTTFTGTGINLTASGGSPGSSNGGSGGAGGAGGTTATGGTTNTTGNTGGSQTATSTSSGFGAGAPNGGGNISGCNTNGCTGGNGSNYGGGGAGGGPRGGGLNSTGGAGSTGAVRITYTSTITLPNAGADQNSCGTLTMDANSPDAGWTGTWTVISGSASITSPNSPTSTVTGIAGGTCATLRWTFSQTGCVSMTDDVVLCAPNGCNDSPCTAAPIPVSSGACSYSSYTNLSSTVSTGMIEPACGTFSSTASEDVWFSAVVPANGVLNLQAVDDNGVAGSFLAGIAVYTGTCSNLMHAGCDATTSTLSPATLTYTGTPGETVYIRIWDYSDNMGGFQLCAFTHTNTVGNLVTGNSTITCGSSYSWMDPGGNANYSDYTTAYYTFCPSTPGQYVSVSFSSFNLYNLDDYLTVMNGGGSFDPIIGNYTGSTLPPTITSSNPDGCLTFAFRADNSLNAAGWLANVTCSSSPGSNTPVCTSTNCSGDCGVWVCGDGVFPTQNAGTASVEEITYQSGGCFQGAGEISTKWFYFTTDQAGTIEIAVAGPNGQDYDFAVYGPTTNGEPPCPSNTGDSPIRCSYALGSATGNPVGLGNGATDFYEDANGNGWVAPLTVNAGETYAMLFNIFMNGNPQPDIDISFAGTGSLDCTPVLLPVTLVDFNAVPYDRSNYITWITQSEINNDYFTVYKSADGINWEVLSTVDGAGTVTHSMFYSLYDNNPYSPITFYKLEQTDMDGETSYSNIISVNRTGSIDLVSELYPNPAANSANFTYNGNDFNTPLNVRVYNELGALIDNMNYIDLHKGTATMLRTNHLADGVYQVVFSQGEITVHQKLTIIR